MTSIGTLGYPISIGRESAASVGEFAAVRGYRQVIVVSDVRVARRAKRIAGAVRASARTALHLFALGERRKTWPTVQRVLQRLSEAGADRSTLVIGVGGGVASDLFGFAAAVYMRGVPYATVSTTLVGMADAAIGGKTGVDLAAGKNLAGAFRDPVAVFCDLDALQTLAPHHVREGLAEIIKAAIIAGDAPFARIEALVATPLRDWPWEEIVTGAIAAKCAIVARDPTESGLREVLNLGHTFAHAIERASGYRFSHGQAVAIGLRGAGLLGLRTGFSEVEYDRILALLLALKLPIVAEGLGVRSLVRAMQSDKKKRDGELRFVVPSAIGDVRYGVSVAAGVVRSTCAELGKRPRTGTLR